MQSLTADYCITDTAENWMPNTANLKSLNILHTANTQSEQSLHFQCDQVGKSLQHFAADICVPSKQKCEEW